MEYLVPTDLARPLLLSLRVAGIATALSFLAALFVAWRLARRRGPLPALLDAEDPKEDVQLFTVTLRPASSTLLVDIASYTAELQDEGER